MSVRYGVSYGHVPYSVALYSCRCGAQVLEPDLKPSCAPGWINLGGDAHLCPECAANRPATGDIDEDGPVPPSHLKDPVITPRDS